jgi:hypothetical protein
MTGYDITCDPGDLYSRKCYVNVHTPSGCVAGAPGCVITQQEIIGYQGTNPISKAPTTAAGTAWQPSLTVLNQDGTAYQPFGSGGIPWTMGGGMAGLGNVMPSSGADPQDWKYITESAPGAQSRWFYQNRTCNPLWPTFGCKTSPPNEVSGGVVTAPDDQDDAGTWAWFTKFFSAQEDYAAQSTDSKIIKWWNSLIGS